MYTLSQPTTVKRIIQKLKNQTLSPSDFLEELGELGNRTDREQLWTALSQYAPDSLALDVLKDGTVELKEAMSFFRTRMLLLAQTAQFRRLSPSYLVQLLHNTLSLPATPSNVQALQILCAHHKDVSKSTNSALVWLCARNSSEYMRVLSEQSWFDASDALEAAMRFAQERGRRRAFGIVSSAPVASSTFEFFQVIHKNHALAVDDFRKVLTYVSKRSRAELFPEFEQDLVNVFEWAWPKAMLSIQEQKKIVSECFENHMYLPVDRVLPIMDVSLQSPYVSLLALAQTPNALILQERNELQQAVHPSSWENTANTVTPSTTSRKKI